MSTLNTVVKSIMFSDFDSDQLNEIVQAVKYRRSEIAKSTKRSVTIGTKVSFVDRHGKKYLGDVTGIKIKNIIVKIGMTNYRVPASMLTIED